MQKGVEISHNADKPRIGRYTYQHRLERMILEQKCALQMIPQRGREADKLYHKMTGCLKAT